MASWAQDFTDVRTEKMINKGELASSYITPISWELQCIMDVLSRT